LACSADFRIACPEARFSANFAQFGFHHIFGLTVTLPGIVGQQRALELLYTGRRLKGEEAFGIGLSDGLVAAAEVRERAHALAAEVAACAPLAIRSIRQTMRAGLADRVCAAAEHEAVEQEWLQSTADWSEGVRAAREGRPPRFAGR
jgi:enoyl-CoA hydratase/carnithine racemase